MRPGACGGLGSEGGPNPPSQRSAHIQLCSALLPSSDVSAALTFTLSLGKRHPAGTQRRTAGNAQLRAVGQEVLPLLWVALGFVLQVNKSESKQKGSGLGAGSWVCLGAGFGWELGLGACSQPGFCNNVCAI